jgi:phage I-like protein
MPSNLLKQTPKIEDGKTWFHTVPGIGRYPGVDLVHNGKTIKDTITVIDRAGLDSMIATFRTLSPLDKSMGVLVDREHFSLDTEKNSDAMAWATDIREEEDGLWTQWEFTAPGRELYDGKILVSRSPVFGLKKVSEKEYQAVAVVCIAMTNTPYFKMLSPFAAARSAGNQERSPNMDKLIQLLNLAPGASEDDVCAAVQALVDANTKLTTDTEAMKQKCRTDKCDAFIAANKGRIKDVAAFRVHYLKDPEAAEGIIAQTLSAAPAPRFAAREATTPSAVLGTTDRNSKRDAAIGAYRSANPGSTMREAVDAVGAANPNLFASETK